MTVTPAEAIAALASRRASVATCESITGGLICGALTSVPGSSDVVRGGLITYATDLKTSLAGVDPGLIARSGVVSEPVAIAMAQGARQHCGADWGIGVTGVAGPGASNGVPAGTVWLAVAGPGTLTARLLAESGQRTQVRTRVVDAAIDLLCEAMGAADGPPDSSVSTRARSVDDPVDLLSAL
ncbi:MAG: CinA family protein [Propionibacteriaceae bacterium]|nr:CinA family protein [Propionibacteriaceae bacterium]